MGSYGNGKSPKSSKSAGKRFNDAVFINWSLTVEQKQAIKLWLPSLEEVDNFEAEIIQDGCKITRGYDERGNAFTCSFVPQPSHKTNYGYILVGRGSTPLKAFKQALYIHREVFSGDWSSYSTSGLSEELDD